MAAITYTTREFNLSDALDGAMVGIATMAGDDMTYLGGTLEYDDSNKAPTYRDTESGTIKRAIYKVNIHGLTVWCTPDGKVVKCSPSDSRFAAGTQLSILVASIDTTYGTKKTMTRSVVDETQYSNEVDIVSMEPRDEFALRAMAVLMNRMEHPDAIDDANLLQVCRTSYRWANAMMIAAADAREALPIDSDDDDGDEEEEDEGGGLQLSLISVNKNSFSTNAEKVLYNIQVALEALAKQSDSGIRIIGSPKTTDEPVHTKEIGGAAPADGGQTDGNQEQTGETNNEQGNETDNQTQGTDTQP